MLIGANGAGKSNLVSALEVISRVWDNSFQEYLGRHGGLPALLHADAEDSSSTATFEIHGLPNKDKHSTGYRVRLQVDRNSEEQAALNREGGSTAVSRPDPEELAGFLKDYSVGNLWEMNLLQGRPSPETPAEEAA